MKRILILVAGLLLLAGCVREEVRIKTDEGTLVLRPLVDNAIRVRLEPADYKPLDELVYVEKVAAPKFSVTRKGGVVEVRTAAMAVRYENGLLTFFDAGRTVTVSSWPPSRASPPTTPPCGSPRPRTSSSMERVSSRTAS